MCFWIYDPQSETECFRVQTDSCLQKTKIFGSYKREKTLPETNSSPLKIGYPKRRFHLPTIHKDDKLPLPTTEEPRETPEVSFELRSVSPISTWLGKTNRKTFVQLENRLGPGGAIKAGCFVYMDGHERWKCSDCCGSALGGSTKSSKIKTNRLRGRLNKELACFFVFSVMEPEYRDILRWHHTIHLFLGNGLLENHCAAAKCTICTYNYVKTVHTRIFQLCKTCTFLRQKIYKIQVTRYINVVLKNSQFFLCNSHCLTALLGCFGAASRPGIFPWQAGKPKAGRCVPKISYLEGSSRDET